MLGSQSGGGEEKGTTPVAISYERFSHHRIFFSYDCENVKKQKELFDLPRLVRWMDTVILCKKRRLRSGKEQASHFGALCPLLPREL